VFTALGGEKDWPTKYLPKGCTKTSTTVRARRRRLSALSVFLCKLGFYGAFAWARRALNSQKWRFSARAAGGEVPALLRRPVLRPGERDAKLAQELGHLQPFIAVFPRECVGQLASFGPT
jgi:hypothetical protein